MRCIDKYCPSILDQAVAIHREAFSGPELAPTGMFLNKIAQGQFFIEDDKVLKGYAIVLETSGPHPFLWEVAVADGFRHQGVGGRLIDEILEWTQQQGDYGMELTVQTDNASAIRLYEAKGFKIDRRLKRYYSSGDGFLMRRTI